MRDDLRFKKGQLADSETTAARLKVQKEKVQQDLEKVKKLEERIIMEKQQTEEKIVSMEDDMANKFTNTDQLRDQVEQQKTRLQTIKQALNQSKNFLNKQVMYHSMKHDTKKNQILQSDIYNRLNEIEKKLINNESQIYAIQQYIEAKGAESNYQQQFQECMGIASEINSDLVKRCMGL
mmetsp:Transcript_28352/g.42940  ORF Transcript_28352/g.42940 Transcript_28352/m.42940 type:complete len:179 (+) Transcript_28352:1160-1696(+)